MLCLQNSSHLSIPLSILHVFILLISSSEAFKKFLLPHMHLTNDISDYSTCTLHYVGTINHSRRIEMEPCCEALQGMGSDIVQRYHQIVLVLFCSTCSTKYTYNSAIVTLLCFYLASSPFLSSSLFLFLFSNISYTYYLPFLFSSSPYFLFTSTRGYFFSFNYHFHTTSISLLLTTLLYFPLLFFFLLPSPDDSSYGREQHYVCTYVRHI